MRGIKIGVALSLIAGLFICSPVSAFSLNPIKSHISVAPGAKGQVVSITVRNDGTEQAIYSIKVLGAKQAPGGQLSYGVNNSQAESWVVPEKTSLTIGAGQEQNVNFLINIPVTATAGSYFLGLAAENAPGTGSETLGVSGQIVSVLLLQVSGVVNESLTIEDFSLPKLSLRNQLSFSLAVKNLGTTEVPLKGEVSMRNWMGREVGKEVINLGSVLLPGSARKYSSELSFPKQILLPGPHNFDIKIVYGLTGQSVIQSRHVWFIPIYSIAALLGLFVVVTIVWFKKKKRYEIG